MSRRKKSETNDLADVLRRDSPVGVSVEPHGELGVRITADRPVMVLEDDKVSVLQGLTDDPSARVAEAVYAQVFAATWVKRQDLTIERRRTAVSVEASLAMDAARGAYVVELGGKPEDQA